MRSRLGSGLRGQHGREGLGRDLALLAQLVEVQAEL
eukprot:CAMPEP_0118884356 /NCGR_PEP_ID=MMETSP1163-20130328/23212_1 /TAXON_ID=124430 /ORGANISM="Phaeomonas parva, Strain CCMP2877" /LENGTH=35 /DNA_ID= /DNA_START= /DNA_END= /DNA_ORIENTATION=